MSDTTRRKADRLVPAWVALAQAAFLLTAWMALIRL
jgi:hypothetical protein